MSNCPHYLESCCTPDKCAHEIGACPGFKCPIREKVMEDKCPFCGALSTGGIRSYGCGTEATSICLFGEGGIRWEQSKDCIIREEAGLAILKARLSALVAFMYGILVNDIDLMDDLNDILSTSEPSEWVMVRIEDLEWALDRLLPRLPIANYNRLKSALKGDQECRGRGN